jgi:hypothetical protein
VTAQQSKVLADLATVFTEYEALALWMKAEYTAAKNPDLLPGLITTEIDGWHAAEQASMPPAIPDDAVVDLGTIASTTTSTAGKPMWIPQRQAAANSGNFPAFTWRPGDTTDARGVDQALARLNTSAPGAFTDWRVPTKAQAATLFSGFVKGHAPTLTTFNSAWQGYDNFQSFLWTSDQVSQVPELLGLLAQQRAADQLQHAHLGRVPEAGREGRRVEQQHLRGQRLQELRCLRPECLCRRSRCAGRDAWHRDRRVLHPARASHAARWDEGRPGSRAPRAAPGTVTAVHHVSRWSSSATVRT